MESKEIVEILTAIKDETIEEDRYHALFYAIRLLKELEHHKALTVGLFATDRPDLIPDEIKDLFFKITFEE